MSSHFCKWCSDLRKGNCPLPGMKYPREYKQFNSPFLLDISPCLMICLLVLSPYVAPPFVLLKYTNMSPETTCFCWQTTSFVVFTPNVGVSIPIFLLLKYVKIPIVSCLNPILSGFSPHPFVPRVWRPAYPALWGSEQGPGRVSWDQIFMNNDGI